LMTMKKTTTWILIADGARAHVVKNDGPGKGLAPTMDHDFWAPHPPTREIGTDKPGRGFESADGARHGKAPRIDFHAFEKVRFAHDMAAMLERAGAKGAYDRLVLVAPPKTLGELRKVLGQESSARLTGELGKDLTHLTLNELAGHLEEVIVP